MKKVETIMKIVLPIESIPYRINYDKLFYLTNIKIILLIHELRINPNITQDKI
jgi:hypothetical protein